MLTAEQIQKVIEQAEKQIEELNKVIAEVQKPQESRAAKSERYWYISDVGMIRFTTDERSDSDDYRYECGNYYLTEEDASRSKKQIRLFRLLDRFSRQNGWTDEVWEDDKTDKWYIYFSYFWGNVYKPSKACYRDICQVYFVSESVARQAIEKYHDLIMDVIGEA